MCFEPIGADYYHIVVVNRWGNKMHEQEGCVNDNPICLWYPPHNITDGVYFYDITFGNQCGQSDENHSFVTVMNYNKAGENENVPKFEQENEVFVYPNPTEDKLFVSVRDKITSLELSNNEGKIVYSVNSVQSSKYVLSLKTLQNGLYSLRIKTATGEHVEKIEKK